MDKVRSARIDEAWVHRLTELARQLKVTKKEILERALALFAEKVEADGGADPLQATFGAWERTESAASLVDKARSRFRATMRRRQP